MEGRILVAGATGRVGGAAVRHLLDAGFPARALVRREESGEDLRSLGAEAVVGDVTNPETLPAAVENCTGIFSALAAGPGRGDAETVEYEGNINLLRAAREAGVQRFIYNSALKVDHPLAQDVPEFREKARFEKELEGTQKLSHTILRPAMFFETLLMPLQGPIAFIPGRQRCPVSWISAGDVARAAVRAFEQDIEGRHEISGPDLCTFDTAYARLARAQGRRITVLHPPIAAMRLPGRLVPYVVHLANMFTLFDTAGYDTDSATLPGTFGIEALTLEGWAAQVS